MIVDFPEPEGPMSPIVYPASNLKLKFFKTFKSGFDG